MSLFDVSLLPRRAMMCIVGVLDIALYAKTHPISGKEVATRHGLKPRHLEVVFQALVHFKVLRSVRGPKGGYSLARDRSKITVGELVRVAASTSTAEQEMLISNSRLLHDLINPVVQNAAKPFFQQIESITIEDLHQISLKHINYLSLKNQKNYDI